MSDGYPSAEAVKITTSVLFGLIHALQSLTQASTNAITSYYFEQNLFERNGLLASSLHHAIRNTIGDAFGYL